MTRTYGQYCPLALALEVLGERWTLLVVSRLADGCRRFNEIQRGLPRMSASLLSQRLQLLEHHGIVERRPVNRRTFEYMLTDAGRELEPLIMDLAYWGQRWARDMAREDLDPGFLAWSMHLRIDAQAMPPGRTVIAFEFPEAAKDSRRFWIVHKGGVVDMCLKDPGFDVDLRVTSNLRLFIEAWRGFRSLQNEIARGAIRLEGPAALRRDFPKLLLLSALASEERKRPGTEHDLAKVQRRTRA